MSILKDVILLESKITYVVKKVFIPHTILGSELWSNWKMAEIVSETLDADQKLVRIEWLQDGFEVEYTQTGI